MANAEKHGHNNCAQIHMKPPYDEGEMKVCTCINDLGLMTKMAATLIITAVINLYPAEFTINRAEIGDNRAWDSIIPL